MHTQNLVTHWHLVPIGALQEINLGHANVTKSVMMAGWVQIWSRSNEDETRDPSSFSESQQIWK